MFRNDSTANSAYVDLIATPEHGIAFQWRSTAGGNTSTASVSGITTPVWLRLKRSGNTFSAYYGTDGTSWTQFGMTANVSLSTTALAGLAVTAHSYSALTTATFSNVTLVSDDTDLDGMSDAWEMENFGSLAASAAGDADGDGQSNWMESQTGTDPRNASSRFAASVAPASNLNFTLTWPSVPGRSYFIEYKASLSGATWLTLTTMDAAASPNTQTSYTDNPGTSTRFYRVRLGP
jgi:hypothetical protein